MSRRLFAAVAAAVSLAAPATALAARPTPAPSPIDPADINGRTLPVICAAPLVGVQEGMITLWLDPPRHVPVDTPTRVPSHIKLSLDGFSAFSAGSGVKTLDGKAQAGAAVSGYLRDANLNATIPSTPLPSSGPLVLSGEGLTDVFTTPEAGYNRVVLSGGSSFSLTARTATGAAVTLPPLTTDADGNPYTDSDGDPSTFDIACRLRDWWQELEPFWAGDTDGPLDFQAPTQPGESPDVSDDDNGVDSIFVRWSPSTDNRGGSGLRGYVVRVNDGEGGDDRLYELGPDATSLQVTGLKPGRYASSLVSAIDWAGNQSRPLSRDWYLEQPVPGETPGPTPNPTATPPVAPAGASTYICRYPLIGLRYVTLNAAATTPTGGVAQTTIGPFSTVANLRLYGLAAGLEGVERAATISGTLNATLMAWSAHQTGRESKLSASFATVPYPATGDDPFAVSAAGSAQAATFDNPGTATLELEDFSVSLRLKYADGTPYILPPAGFDADGQEVADSDGDPETFDIYCRPVDKQAPPAVIGSFDLAAPSPSPTPEPADDTPPTVPGLSPDVRASDVTANSILVRWTPSTDAPGANGLSSGVDHYTVAYRSLWGESTSVDVPADQTSFTVTPLAGHWEHSVYVSAVDGKGNTSNALAQEYSTKDAGGPPTLMPSPTPMLTPTPKPPTPIYDSPIPTPVTPTPLPVTPAPTTRPSPTTTTAPTTTAIPSTPTPTPKPATPKPTPRIPLTPAPPTPAPVLSYSLNGTTKLNTLTKGTMPLTGALDGVRIDASTGTLSADLALNDTQGRLIALGFLPVTATVGFVPSGSVTGALVSGSMLVESKVRIKVKSVKAFGAIPLAGGNTCQTKQLTALRLVSSGAFDPTVGGVLGGTYTISDLNGCGPFGGVVSSVTAGSGNEISVKLATKR